MSLRFLALITLVACLLPGVLDAAAAAQQPPQVTRIDFTGRMNVPEEKLRAALTLKAGEAFTPQRMEADRRALMALGFFRSVGASPRINGSEAQVTFRLAEWPRVIHIRVLGNTVVERQALLEAISTERGQVLCAPQLQSDIGSIERLYRERGYVAQVSDRLLDEATRSGILRFEILEVRIDEVRIDGAPPDLAERARRALLEVPSGLYRPDAVAEDRERLLAVRGVKTAAPQVEAIMPGKVRIRWLLNQASGRQ